MNEDSNIYISNLKILGLDGDSDIDIENAYKTAMEAWTIDESAPEEFKNRCKQQKQLIEEAYKFLLEQPIFESAEQNTNSEKNNINSTNEEYNNFKVEIDNVEFEPFKIRYWWRILYISILSIIMIVYCFSPQLHQQKRNIQNAPESHSENKIEEKVNNENTIKENIEDIQEQITQEKQQDNHTEINNQKNEDTNTDKNSAFYNQENIQNTTSTKQIYNQKEIIQNKTTSQVPISQSPTQTSRPTPTPTPNIIPKEYLNRQIDKNYQQTQTNKNSDTVKKYHNGKSDFDSVSDYFE